MQYLSLDEASEHLPGKPDRAKILRWIRQGLCFHGVRSYLKGVPGSGGIVYTSHEWISEFIVSLATRPEQQPRQKLQKKKADSARAREIDRAMEAACKR